MFQTKTQNSTQPRPIDSYSISTGSPESNRSRSIDSFPLSLGLSPEQLAEQECLTNLGENTNISRELKQKLCKIINGVLVNTDDTPNNLFGELMSIWYNDTIVVSEIYKTLRRNGLHITNKIVMVVKPMDEDHRILIGLPEDNDMPLKTANDDKLFYFYISVDVEGRSTYFNADVFKHQMNKYLESDQLFAIPFSFSGFMGTHANMLIIRQYKNEKYEKPVIECEHFEPHGQYFLAESNKEYSDFIINRVWEIIHLLFDPEKYKIIVLNPNQICPIVEKYDTLQGLTTEEWGGSCAIFSLWYMFLRLLNPSRSRSETYYLMNNFLKSSHSANDIIRQIIATFTSLVTVDLTTVNGTPLMLDTSETLEQKVFPDGVFPTEGGRMNLPKPTRKKKFKTVKKRNKGGRKKTRRRKTIIKKGTNNNNKIKKKYEM